MICRTLLAVALVTGCSDANDYAQATCAMVDVSGTYADQRPEMVNIIKRALLPRMLPGDSLVVVRIDDDSFSRENVVGTLTLDHRPSLANAQKMQFSHTLTAFRAERGRSKYTDIRGGLMLCGEYLKETGAGHRDIVVFSDMKEELRPGAKRDLDPAELAGVRVAAMNVKKLREDSHDPTLYRQRLAAWKEQLAQTGAEDWRVILEPDKLLAHLDVR